MTQRAADLLERIARGITLRRELESLELETAAAFRALDGIEQAAVCRQLGLLNTTPKGGERIEA